MTEIGGRLRIEVVLHQTIYDCVSPWLAELERRAAARLGDTLERLGISSRPSLCVTAGSGTRAVRLLVEDVEQPFPPSFLARLWYSVAERELREQAFDSMPAAKREVHVWLIRLAATVGRSAPDQTGEALVQLVERLVPDIASLHPGAMLSEAAAAAFFSDADTTPMTAAAPILRDLLELGVSLRDRPRVAAAVRASLALTSTQEQAFENAFAALRSQVVEIQLDAITFDALVKRDTGAERVTADALDSDVREAMDVVYAHRLRKLGADLPVVFVRSPSRRRCQMRIQVNDRRSPPVPLPSPDEVGVSASPRALERTGARSRRLIDPLTGAHLSAVHKDDAGAVAAAGFVPVPPAAYLVAAFGRGVTPLAHRLVAIDAVERMLAWLEPESPVLVHMVLSRFSPAVLTRLFRALVQETTPIDDLWRILNAILRFCEIEDAGVAPETTAERALAYVRRELGDRIVVGACQLDAIGEGVAYVHETGLALEQQVERWAQSPPTDDELRDLRSTVWNAVGGLRSDLQPVVVTSPAARLALRIALDHELPDVQVLARTEIVTDVQVECLATIGA